MSRRGICHIWFRGRHISPSMPYREARSVAESSEGPTASKSDRTGRNPGMTRLVRRSSAGVWRYCVFLSCSNIASAHAQMFWLFDTYNLGQNLLRQSGIFGTPTTYPNVQLKSRPFPSPPNSMLSYLGRKFAVEHMTILSNID